MSNFVGKRPNPLAYAIQKISQKLSGQGKTTGKEVIKNINIAKNIDTKKAIEQKVVKTVDKAFKDANVPPSLRNQQKKSQLKRDEGKKLKSISYRLDKLEERVKKAGGGMMRSRMGLKRGGGKFPDLNKDGKTSFADVLVGRGVLPKPKGKKKTMMAKKSKSPMDKTVRKA